MAARHLDSRSATLVTLRFIIIFFYVVSDCKCYFHSYEQNCLYFTFLCFCVENLVICASLPAEIDGGKSCIHCSWGPFPARVRWKGEHHKLILFSDSTTGFVDILKTLWGLQRYVWCNLCEMTKSYLRVRKSLRFAKDTISCSWWKQKTKDHRIVNEWLYYTMLMPPPS